VGKFRQGDARDLELLALHHVGEIRVLGDDGMVEFGDHLARHAVPMLEGGAEKAGLAHLLFHAVLGKDFQRRGMGRGRARVVLQRVMTLEDRDGHTRPRQAQRGDQADRTAACDDDAVRGHTLSLPRVIRIPA
jgi:hypothetical protein